MRRFLRIWPAFALTVIVCGAVAVFTARDAFAQLAAWLYFANLAFHAFDPGSFVTTPRHELNGSLWTIPYEVECYLLLAGTGLLLGRWLKWLLLAGIASILVWFGWVGGQRSLELALSHWGTFPHLTYFGAFFITGALFFYLDDEARKVGWLVLAAVCALAFGQYELATLLLIPSASVWVGVRSWPILRSASSHGDLSFGIYLWAWPIAQVGVIVFGRQAPFLMMLLATLVGSLVFALLSWHLIEEHALRWKPVLVRNGGAVDLGKS